MLILLIFDEINDEILLFIDIYFSLILICLVMLVFIYLLKKFIGSPYKNMDY